MPTPLAPRITLMQNTHGELPKPTAAAKPGCLSPSEGRRAWTCSRYSAPTSGTERLRQILRARLLGISVCRGTPPLHRSGDCTTGNGHVLHA
jgi:hypothetical protein